ncbi:MAG: phosphogluconate dehydrogenase (NAD(+)-dependent, decarboxylating) [Nitrospinota bacterium]|nr:decarboxylating 6-phosphogluconate dehydrogenase [Nitrospinota bacterium]
MQLGFIGLGRMGYNMVLNLLEQGHKVVAHNRSPDKVDDIAKDGAIPAYKLEEMIAKLEAPRIVWLMLPAGSPVEDMLKRLADNLSAGDIVIDGGNTFYKDTIRHGERLAEKGIYLIDVGTSGGIDGARNGACMMIGGEEKIFKKVEPICKDISVDGGYAYLGGSGTGHFVKMVHNGIEYGMMQSIGEGLELIERSGFDIDLQKTAAVWSNGSVIRGWLIDLINDELKKDPTLKTFTGPVLDSGEGKWAVEAGLEHQVPLPAISSSIWARFRSRGDSPMTDRVISALREGFGHHISGKK